MSIICIDFETFYDKAYSLSNMTYDAYIHDLRFEVIGVSVQIDDNAPKWFSGSRVEVQVALDRLELHKHAVIAHNAMFDCSILAFAFGIKPKIIFDTLSMARAVHGAVVGGSLKKLAKHYGIGVKGEEVHTFIGYGRAAFSPEELSAYANYCKNDVKLTRHLFGLLLPYFNRDELKLIDMTIRMYTEPTIEYDRDILEGHLEDTQARQQKFISDLGLTAIDLRSNLKFADLLKAQGVEPPTKLNRKGIESFAFAKTDEGLKALLEHDNLQVQALVSARLGVKSSIEATRTQAMINTGDRCNNRIPIGLLYYGARSGRWSACIVADSLLTVYNTRYGVHDKKIVDVLLSDLIWDGEEFVSHDGVVFNGYAEVISYDGITGTPDHVVFTTDDKERTLLEAMQGGYAIKNTRYPTQDDVERSRFNVSGD